ncbi:hypothetical protein P3S67_007092 [Capsicum chacoense]
MRLDIINLRLLNGETAPGFVDFAVNIINIDIANLHCVTNSCPGLRETLFYTLFSELQVYKTKANMLNALPLISDGAISLDGGIIKTRVVFAIGKREVIIKFPKSSGSSNIPENNFETVRWMKEITWKRTRFMEYLKLKLTLLDIAKSKFETKKKEFVKFIALPK